MCRYTSAMVGVLCRIAHFINIKGADIAKFVLRLLLDRIFQVPLLDRMSTGKTFATSGPRIEQLSHISLVMKVSFSVSNPKYKFERADSTLASGSKVSGRSLGSIGLARLMHCPYSRHLLKFGLCCVGPPLCRILQSKVNQPALSG